LTLLKDLTAHVAIELSLVPEFKEFMKRKFHENKTRIREILLEREKKYPEKKTVSIGVYGGITTAIHYSLVLRQYDAILTAPE
jgi:hypothetical protein